MKVMIIALTAALSIYAGVELADTIVPKASAGVAEAQGIAISDAAYYQMLMTGDPWPEALRAAVSDTRHNEGQLTLNGTTLVLDLGDGIWCISLPDPDSSVAPVRCDQ